MLKTVKVQRQIAAVGRLCAALCYNTTMGNYYRQKTLISGISSDKSPYLKHSDKLGNTLILRSSYKITDMCNYCDIKYFSSLDSSNMSGKSEEENNNLKSLKECQEEMEIPSYVQPQYLYFHPPCQLETRIAVMSNFEVIQDYINEEEEAVLVKEVEPHLRRLKYQFDHWDDFCGSIICGLCLLSDAVMRLVHVQNKDQVVDIFLQRRSLYVMKDECRYKYSHEVLGEKESYFGAIPVPRERRISVICRNYPTECGQVHPSTAGTSSVKYCTNT
nr:uncharacterized protein LOC128693669 isoform X1 [Cherax quadricarinatus]